MRGLTAIGMLVLTLSGWLVWIRAPLSGAANASLSFGWLAGAIGGLALIAWLWRSNRLLAVCGMAGLGLVSFTLLHLTFMDPALWSLVDENTQATNIIRFSRRYLPGNFGIQPTFRPNLETDTLWGRLSTASYFLSWGWAICLVGSAFALLGALHRPDQRHLRRWIGVPAALLLASQVGLLFSSLVAKYDQDQGDRAMALGHYAQAVRRYERAQGWNRQLAASIRLHVRLGEAYERLEMSTQPNARLYLGERYSQQGDYRAALAAYQLAAQEATGSLQELLHKRMAWTYADGGIALYRRGLFDSAIGYWEQALRFDATQLQAAYFLARAYFEQSRYEQSIAMSRFLLTRSHNRQLNANVQANIGDSYWRLQDFMQARRAYEASMRLDSYGNFRMFKSLGGT